MQVVYGVDSNYVLPALISVFSMWKSASRPLDVTIFGENFGQRDHDVIRQVSTSCGRTISVQEFDPSGFSEYSRTTKSRFPVITLLPLVLPSLMEGRCLFLDADTLVLGDVWELLSADLGGMPIGACTDVGQALSLENFLRIRASDVLRPKYVRRKREAQLRRILNLNFIPTEQYFNSGVLVMDCDSIREFLPPDVLCSASGLRQHVDQLPDQDRLNEVFADHWHRFPLKWNTHSGMARVLHKRKGQKLSNMLRAQVLEAANTPQLWHFMGATKKPWVKSWKTALARRQDYRDYRAMCREFEVRTGVTV